MNILVTGANGFVGTALCRKLVSHQHCVSGTIRSSSSSIPLVKPIRIDSISSPLPHNALTQVDAIVHLAARVHQMEDKSADPLKAFRQINTQATLALAKEAVHHSVRRFIYLSSIKVNGEGQKSSIQAYTEKDIPNPQDPYAQSKWEAEQLLTQLAKETGLEVVILRPPLVYGAGVKANFAKLLKLISLGVPLPINSANNCRSLIYVENLVDAIVTCISDVRASGQTFMVSDDEHLSTPELVKRIAFHLDKKAHLLPCPPHILRFLGKIMGQKASVERLLDSLILDSSKIKYFLNWQPPFSIDQGLQVTANWYKLKPD